MLATVVGWLVSLAGSPLIRAVADVLTAKANDDLAKEQLRVGADQALALSRLQAAEQTATLQAQVRLQEGRWGPTVVAGVLLFVVPSGIHYWAVVLDSIPLLGHAVGSWRIAALPAAFAAMEHSIIMSLFIVGGASMALGRIFSR